MKNKAGRIATIKKIPGIFCQHKSVMGEAVSSLKEVALWTGLVRIRRLKIITSSTEQTRAWIFQ